jgi:PIN domain nuclease of toxin-antitoxin system
MSVAVTDSQALIWYATGPTRKLGRRARNLFARAERGEATIYIPVLVLVEIAEAMRRGAVLSDFGFGRWSERLLASRRFSAVDLTPAVVVEAEALYAIPERGDRLIAATASHLACPLITNDPAISRVPGLATIW